MYRFPFLVALVTLQGACAELESLTFSSWEFFDAAQSIRSSGDAVRQREAMMGFVFGDALPTRQPDDIEAISDPAYPGLEIDRITVWTDDLSSIAYLIHPAESVGTLAIYHQGHGGDFRTLGQETILGLLNAGHRVLAFSMPMRGMNTHPFGTSNHGALQSREHPLRYFAEPVVVALNWVEAIHNSTRRFMVGLSGGGWTTVLVAGIDTRIDASYAVAGSWPHYLRDMYGSVGDYEQQITPNYLELYLLATHPDREQIQVFNEFDPTCFGGLAAYDYLAYTSYIANEWNGRFEILIDHDQTAHTLSPETLAEILAIEQPVPLKHEPQTLPVPVNSAPTLELSAIVDVADLAFTDSEHNRGYDSAYRACDE